MKDVIFEIIILAMIMILIATSGCATLKGFLQGNTETETIAPKPTEQLWQAAKRSNWLVTLSILGIAAGVFALTNGATKLGTAGIASASVSLFMSLAVARFALWMAVFGLIGSAAAALFSILARRKALVEIIQGVQNYRKKFNIQAVASLDGRLNDSQSSTTKKIVGNIKNELKLQGKI